MERGCFPASRIRGGEIPVFREGNLGRRLLNCCGQFGDSERRQAWCKVGFSPRAGSTLRRRWRVSVCPRHPVRLWAHLCVTVSVCPPAGPCLCVPAHLSRASGAGRGARLSRAVLGPPLGPDGWSIVSVQGLGALRPPSPPLVPPPPSSGGTRVTDSCKVTPCGHGVVTPSQCGAGARASPPYTRCFCETGVGPPRRPAKAAGGKRCATGVDSS